MRITGKQLRQIIQEEVSRMMSEADAPMPAAASIGEVLTSARNLESMINDVMGTNFGSVQNFIGSAYNGRNPKNAEVIKQLLAKPESGGGFMMSYDDYLPAMIKIVYASGGQTVKVGSPMGPPLNYTVNGKVLLSQQSDEGSAVASGANAAARFLKAHFGA